MEGRAEVFCPARDASSDLELASHAPDYSFHVRRYLPPELPDKTALATLVLATRYSVRQVVLGAWLAFLVQTLVAIAAGSIFQLLPGQLVRAAAGVGFLVFAIVAIRKDEQELIEEEEEEVEAAGRRHWAPWMASFLVVFAAEWGDLTQLATAALVAQTREPLAVGIGATAALWSVTVIAVIAGSQLGRFVKQGLINRISAALFAIVGLFMIGTAILGG